MKRTKMEEILGGMFAEKLTEITVHDPSGAQEILYHFAERLDSLDGKVIAELAVDPVKWQPHRTFPVIEEEIKKRYPAARFIPYTEFPQGVHINDDTVAKAVQERGADACIIGNAV
jgi:hypothetical protein